MSIQNKIREKVIEQGYVYVDEFMAMAMSSEFDSYYRSKQPLGPDADFITSPEISQMFGEMIGLWCVQKWEKLGKPNPVNILELGPGRGLLMNDLLRATKNAQGFHEAIQIQLLEINKLLIEEQRKKLKGYKVSWISKIQEAANIPTLMIANEFFDALPIRQYIKVKKEWHEMALVLDPEEAMLKFDKRPMMPRIFAGQVNLDHIQARDGAVIEESPESIAIVQSLADHLKAFKGAALVIDYGYDVPPVERTENQYMGTLQAIKNHQFAPILSSLGEADLSAHVDFYSLRQAAKVRMIEVKEIITQGKFLKDMGIELRLKILQQKNPELAEVLARQVSRLTADDQMGKLFKVMELESIPSKNIG